MALKVQCGIASDIAESGYYSIMADESTDAGNIEQLVIYIRWMDKEMTVCDKFIGLMPVTQTNADTIVVCIKDVLLCMNLSQEAHWQCYDGCWTMTGTKNWVTAQIKKLNGNTLPRHCSCLSLNFAVRDTIKKYKLLN